ncbi:MAG: hypothetical protein WC865_11155 [Bacteroidales bacterium]
MKIFIAIIAVIFVVLDFVKGTNGRDFLDRQSNTECNSENRENQFTELALDSRKTLEKSYWFGSRYVNLRDPADDMTVRALGALGGEVGLSAISGKVVMQLPTNITGILLAKGDIGIEKPFAGGVITLKEIKDDNISFQFTGDSNKLYSWTVYDDSNAILDINEVLLNDGLYHLYAEHPQSVKVYKAEIVCKEYPFAFETERHYAPNQTPESADTKTGNTQTDNVVPVYLDKNDPVSITIKGRAITDLKHSSDLESTDNKLIAAKIETLTTEKQNQLEALFIKAISDYTATTHFEVGIFILLFNDLGKKDQKELAKEFDIRVQILGSDQYAAEFWEAGKQEPINKVMSLLYVQEKDGSITYRDPFQPVLDFISR